MTIQEAIRSGKRFRRKWWESHQGWIFCCAGDLFLDQDGKSPQEFKLCGTLVLADDWEVEEEKIEITKARISEALKLSMAQCSPYSPECIPSANFMDQLSKNLGFED